MYVTEPDLMQDGFRDVKRGTKLEMAICEIFIDSYLTPKTQGSLVKRERFYLKYFLNGTFINHLVISNFHFLNKQKVFFYLHACFFSLSKKYMRTACMEQNV